MMRDGFETLVGCCLMLTLLAFSAFMLTATYKVWTEGIYEIKYVQSGGEGQMKENGE